MTIVQVTRKKSLKALFGNINEMALAPKLFGQCFWLQRKALLLAEERVVISFSSLLLLQPSPLLPVLFLKPPDPK